MKTFVVFASCLTVASAGFAVAQFGGSEQLGRANTNHGFHGGNENVRSITNSVPSLPSDLFSTSSSEFKMFGVREGGGNNGFNDFASAGGNGFDRGIRHGGGAGTSGSGISGYENVLRQGGSSGGNRGGYDNGVRHGSGAGANVGGQNNGIRNGGGAGGNGGGYESGMRHGGGAGSNGAGGYANGVGQGSGTGANGSNNVGGGGQGNGADANAESGKQGGQIRRFVSVHVAPDDNTPVEPRVINVGGIPDTHFNIIFVKAPTTPVQQTEVVLPPNPKQKTLVYVLVKKADENQDNVKIKTPEPTKPSKPEVFFIRYKDEPEVSAGGAGPESDANSNGNISEGHGESNGFGPGGDGVSSGSPSMSYGAPPPQHGGEPARYQ